jgi:hypothetical protein
MSLAEAVVEAASVKASSIVIFMAVLHHRRSDVLVTDPV